ncbi:Serine/threonine-protein kinase 17A isoform 1 [Schistosoma japonicum]|uniref:SJCHGC06342 protein n=1 Tax=Schistosoma japonicum TaxID=6182 RepID=Q5DBY2_SCHJA|nr:SJCHGC06342 protein [Schistosoma japonicum]TNN17209.1 Serine/threonine-protein kinase 17A isoform 1 [Schistosoma japonicum]
MSCCVVQTSYTSGQTLASSHEAELFRSNYTIETQIGRGRFAKVALVKHCESGEVSAAKIIRRWRCGKDTLANIMQEIDIMKTGHYNSHIVKMKHYYIGEKEVVLLLENCSHGDLYHYVHYSEEPLPENIVIEVLWQLLKALSFIHSQSIVHLDIKPENILLRRPLPHCDIALCDFGLAKYLRTNEVIRDLVGTPDYAAPEVLNYDPIHLTTDIWSVGVVVYYLLTSESPFWDESKEHTYLNVCQLKISYPDYLFHNISVEAIAFIKRLIQRNPKDRPSAIDCLDDPWFSSTNFTDALNTDKCNQNELITVSNEFTMSNNQNFVE